MSSVLAIETSTRTGSVALARDGILLSGQSFVAERSHNAQIFAPLGALAKGAEIDAVVVGTGPGSYTGVRIGIATGIGISLARDVPLVGIPSVCGVETDGDYAVVGDARRGAYFCCRVGNGQLLGEPELMTLDALETCTAGGSVFTFDPAAPIASAVITAPSAGVLAMRASLNDWRDHAGEPVEPIYLRAPFITTPKARGKTLD